MIYQIIFYISLNHKKKLMEFKRMLFICLRVFSILVTINLCIENSYSLVSEMLILGCAISIIKTISKFKNIIYVKKSDN